MEKPSPIKTNRKNKVSLDVPPWIFIGAVILLFPIFTFITINNINRQKENSIRLLFEKGAALIRAFEAGTRSGMMMHGSNFHLQQLLTETAQQPDISYLLVTDTTGRILAHNNPSYIGKFHGNELNLLDISNSSNVNWRQIPDDNGEKVFEVFSKFTPTPSGLRHGQMMRREWFHQGIRDRNFNEMPLMIIFIGLDMSSIESARWSDTRHTVVMTMILLLVGLSGIILLFLTHSYRAAKTSLYRIKAFSDNIVENMPIGILTTDTQKKIASINSAAENILCVSANDVIGKEVKYILPDRAYKKVENLNNSQGFIEEEIDCTVRGKKIPIELNATILNDETGKFLGKVILLKDLSEVSDLRKEIARNQRLASVGRLAAGVAHEIRNPLSSIKGFATYFKERYGKKAEDKNIADVMIQEVERLNRVVSQLLEFSKPIAITKKSVQIKPFIEASLKMIERQAAESNIDIRTKYLSEEDKGLFDPDRLSQVLLNLYLNALESMNKGGMLSVEVKKDDEKKGIVIIISDTGAGISENDIASIFDPYFTTKPAGTGIGLALVHNIIEAHNGSINVSSTPGRGTRITVFLSDV